MWARSRNREGCRCAVDGAVLLWLSHAAAPLGPPRGRSSPQCCTRAPRHAPHAHRHRVPPPPATARPAAACNNMINGVIAPRWRMWHNDGAPVRHVATVDWRNHERSVWWCRSRPMAQPGCCGDRLHSAVGAEFRRQFSGSFGARCVLSKCAATGGAAGVQGGGRVRRATHTRACARTYTRTAGGGAHV